MEVQPPAAPPAGPSPSSADERRSVSRITWYAVLNLATGVLGAATAGAAYAPMLSAGMGAFPGRNIPSSGPTAQQLQAMSSAFQYMTVLLPIVLIIGLAGLGLLWTAFRGLSRAGAREFSLPSRFTLVTIIAGVLFIPGLVIIFSSIVPLMTALANSGAASGAPPLGTIGLGAGLLGVGALLSLTGVIGGVVLGLWRAGAKYGETGLKVGAIFTIIPFLSIVAPIAVIIGVNGAKRKLGQA